MGALSLLGVPIAGDRFPRQPNQVNAHLSPEAAQRAAVAHAKRREHLQRLNPVGYWEIPGVVSRGLQELDGHGGRAIKIVTRGILPPTGLRGTDPGLVWRYLLCLRDPRHVAESQRDLRRPVEVPGETIDGWTSHRARPDPGRYLETMGRLAIWLAEDSPSGWLVVDYDRTLGDPLTQLSLIAQFLGYLPSIEQLSAAAASYWPELRRSPATAGAWPAGRELDGQVAEAVYEALKGLGRRAESGERKAESGAELAAARVAVLERLEAQQLERAQWYSPEVCWMIDASIQRKIASDSEFRDSLRKSAWRGLLTGYHPQVCAEYYEPVDAPVYTIRRPADLGDWSATCVRYRGRIETREQAFRVHQVLCCDPNTPAPEVDHQKVKAWRWRW